MSQSSNNEKKPLPIVKDNLLVCSQDACPLYEEDMGPGWARFCTVTPHAELNDKECTTVCLPGIKLEHEELLIWREKATALKAKHEVVKAALRK